MPEKYKLTLFCKTRGLIPTYLKQTIQITLDGRHDPPVILLDFKIPNFVKSAHKAHGAANKVFRSGSSQRVKLAPLPVQSILQRVLLVLEYLVPPVDPKRRWRGAGGVRRGRCGRLGVAPAPARALARLAPPAARALPAHPLSGTRRGRLPASL